MNNQKIVFNLIKELVGQNNILTIPRLFIDYTGSLDCALLLSQIIYWSDKNSYSEWFYKSYVEWKAELGLTQFQVARCVATLKRLGIIETKLKRANGSPTIHYHLLQPRFSHSIIKFLNKRKSRKLINHNIDYTETKRELSKPNPDSLDSAWDLLDSLDKADQLNDLHWQAQHNQEAKH